ncbi:MAG TPA: isoprenylcysteine carboxylmethyltransferase family protein [Thermoanaerobaculia bacterium]|nr:isoprenylcysteine carboxylmethyltransferase family protein [Thermoanaerobaculia bacterium]
MSRVLSFAYGAVSYILFLGTFLYAIGFVGNMFVPKSIDSGEQGPVTQALLINTALLLLFAVQHSVMARPWFKRWWTRFVPHAIERSTFVLFASLALIVLYWQWRPMKTVVWSLDGTAGAIMQVIFWSGWILVLLSTFMISHFHLFGLKQVHQHLRRERLTDPEFGARALYRYMRHPIMAGFFLAFWGAATMTLGHLLFAVATTGYILVALQFEERDLLRAFGSRYEQYRREVRMFLPIRKAPPSGEVRGLAAESGE